MVEAYPILSETIIGIAVKSKGRLSTICEVSEVSVPELDFKTSCRPVPDPPSRTASLLEEMLKFRARVDALS